MKPMCLLVLLLALPPAFVRFVIGDEPAPKTGARQPRYETRKEHDPNGIGKFYMGREIAQVMGHEAAGWLERPEREKEEQPAKLLDALKLKPGDVVADIGAGSGYLTFRLAERVGSRGRVFAVDIQPEMLALIRQRMKAEQVTNVEPIQGTESDPKLPRHSADLILMVDVYHEFSYPWEMTQAMIRSLRTGGRLVFVEYRLEDPQVPIKLVHKMSEKQVRKEMEPHPLIWVETLDTLPRQHIIVFKKKEDGSKNASGKRQPAAREPCPPKNDPVIWLPGEEQIPCMEYPCCCKRPLACWRRVLD